MNETLTPLVEALHDPDRNVRSRAAVSLGNLANTASLDALLAALEHEADLNVREDITWALVRMGDTAVQPLIDLMCDPNPAARHNAAHTLGKIGDAHAVEALIAALGDSDNAVRLKAAFALGQIGDEKAIPALVGLLGGEHRETQATINQVLEDFGASALSALLAALRDERWQVREQAADILGLIGDQEAVPALIDGLQDAEWQVRFAVVMALGTLGGATAKAAVASMQTDPEQRVRDLVATLAKRIKD